ncbi:hypothetical protein CC85DRAFT_2033 [Cutaneotrichosporon oleaginosum]|uniref:Uncharacterized protein n=1 Tax=Cutaneotrichosporon oleaginosum TaxID=879819 RepID=A0A0J1BEB2_9TREE|nr:uncharacterized protein CC85DRAFT_2033 [Cutaneotrichosporon oleaginosum]KLT46429.1 hypothetical protein CC85DRAFT_2033 [Cutaneotrichosporon oleaginosum]TXT15201.1 hypothetical protein COLE_01394 [Cutaneotrichosporon oleaginosum]
MHQCILASPSQHSTRILVSRRILCQVTVHLSRAAHRSYSQQPAVSSQQTASLSQAPKTKAAARVNKLIPLDQPWQTSQLPETPRPETTESAL